MAWQDELVTMLRQVIGDVGSSPTYSDSRLEDMLVTASHMVIQEIPFTNTYTVDISNVTISPDPTTEKDTEFKNFAVLKAACLADQSTLRTKALQAGISAKLGGASISTSNSLKGYEVLLNQGPCAAYQEMKWEYELGNANAIRAILSPFVGPNYDATSSRNTHFN
jgi:hypothetical protein